MLKPKSKIINQADSATSPPSDSDVAVLRQAGNTLDEMLLAHAVDAEAVVADFKVARQLGAAIQKTDITN